MKQGFWYEYKISKILTTDSFRQNPKAIGFHNDEGRVYVPIAEGYYKNNKRIGEWKFYKGSFYNDNYTNPTSHEQTVSFTDSGYFKVIDTFWHFSAKVSNDTSNLMGIVYLKNDTVTIKCLDKKCFYRDPFNDNKKKKVAIKYLDDILIQLNWYDRRFKPKKIGS